MFAFIVLILFLFQCYPSFAAPTAYLASEYIIVRDANNQTAVTTAKRGWVSSPNERGTIDIIWSSLITMFLCSWSLLCLNVPAPKHSILSRLHLRLWLTALCFLGPEFTLVMALGQYASARQSVIDFANAKAGDWTMNHAFYANMGGFMLHTPDFAPFPVDAKQLLFLIKGGFVELPKLQKRAIADKNKVDGMLRLITLLQVLWFTINVIGRIATRLTVTCLELTTAAFIICAVGTSYCWLHKPADVEVPEDIYSSHSIVEIEKAAWEAAKSDPTIDPNVSREIQTRTPLDFLSRKEWAWSKYWTNWINILRNMKIVFAPKQFPVDRFENTVFLPLPKSLYTIWSLIALAYSSIFVAAWNFEFPTPIERTLWHIATLGLLVSAVAYWVITHFAYDAWPSIRSWLSSHLPEMSSRIQKKREASINTRLGRKLHKLADMLRNNSPNKDPALTIPLKAILPIYVLGVLYCTSRTYILLADIVELRSLPADAFEQVDWSVFVPHFH
ncbi:hypothetical protein BT63DRAFT_308818 [Microthyrium microscopicum]|uniref:Uncharacterized protein n=1 Tax=Microthyrium microscopicum TaxID=703497 RepID=A0A6A6UAY3_9PEZI|nr:hypothetical protein BT63DRAFT_308818 [Microthyrium microscopicum]